MRLAEVAALGPDERAAMARLKDEEVEALQETLRNTKSMTARDEVATKAKIYDAKCDALLLRGVKDDAIGALRGEAEMLKAALAGAMRERAQLQAEVEALRETLRGLGYDEA